LLFGYASLLWVQPIIKKNRKSSLPTQFEEEIKDKDTGFCQCLFSYGQKLYLG
jgi:hypothetical protein